MQTSEDDEADNISVMDSIQDVATSILSISRSVAHIPSTVHRDHTQDDGSSSTDADSDSSGSDIISSSSIFIDPSYPKYLIEILTNRHLNESTKIKHLLVTGIGAQIDNLPFEISISDSTCKFIIVASDDIVSSYFNNNCISKFSLTPSRDDMIQEVYMRFDCNGVGAVRNSRPTPRSWGNTRIMEHLMSNPIVSDPSTSISIDLYIYLY